MQCPEVMYDIKEVDNHYLVRVLLPFASEKEIQELKIEDAFDVCEATIHITGSYHPTNTIPCNIIDQSIEIACAQQHYTTRKSSVPPALTVNLSICLPMNDVNWSERIYLYKMHNMMFLKVQRQAKRVVKELVMVSCFGTNTTSSSTKGRTYSAVTCMVFHSVLTLRC